MGAATMTMQFFKPGGIMITITDEDHEIVSRWELCDGCQSKQDHKDGAYIGDFLWFCHKCKPGAK